MACKVPDNVLRLACSDWVVRPELNMCEGQWNPMQVVNSVGLPCVIELSPDDAIGDLQVDVVSITCIIFDEFIGEFSRAREHHLFWKACT